MAIECNYSFAHLYAAAFNKQIGSPELAGFAKLSQDQKNKTVKLWAQKAGWETQDKIGRDGKVYTAFAPSFSIHNKQTIVCE